MIDMHCHLDLYANPKQVVEQCRKRSMYVLSVTTTPKAWKGTVSLAEGCDRIRTSLGLHPQLAHERYLELELFDTLLPQAKYVGEIGLDGSKNYQPHYGRQVEVFRHILQSVQQAGGRIMTIHSRNATSDVLEELSGYPSVGIPILHWFTGTKTELKRAIALGCWFSVGPAMLDTKRGIALVNEMPKDRLLTETDGPFATMNNEKLMPWDVELVQKQIAKIWLQDAKTVQDRIFSNFKSLLTL
jgi:TatD DNase family protein